MQGRNVIFDIALHVVGVLSGRRTLPNFLASIDSFRFPIIMQNFGAKQRVVNRQTFQKERVIVSLGKMQYPQEHSKTMVYAKFGGQLTECVMGDSKIESRFLTTIATNVAPPRAGSSACGSSLKELFHQNSNSENCHQLE